MKNSSLGVEKFSFSLSLSSIDFRLDGSGSFVRHATDVLKIIYMDV